MEKIDTLRFALTGKTQQIGRHWRRLVHDIVATHGVSDAAAVPLIQIERMGGGVNQTEVADAIGIEGASLVRLLDQLCASGLIERREGADRRAKTLWLTDEGERVTSVIEQELVGLRTRILGHLSQDDIEATLRVFRAIEEASARQQAEAAT
ncbi:MarR family winged helix-turn-helix transcriptional regulator [Labrys sp. ZIDIC5]|uniref:MarR family winged helix-turn-helix transcriptional regulator n=1 Tax=Labrys sedimenti TaxID=3106036 RepID=UPI002ACA25B6|nr:MarR family transcriptional regulator [Labrys sp. ZIDIC5]MDZ5449164.1 MarR family transcriptional regulator [Labrys sp. ZIDIC5]